jgi:hypothetical protein
MTIHTNTYIYINTCLYWPAWRPMQVESCAPANSCPRRYGFNACQPQHEALCFARLAWAAALRQQQHPHAWQCGQSARWSARTRRSPKPARDPHAYKQTIAFNGAPYGGLHRFHQISYQIVPDTNIYMNIHTNTYIYINMSIYWLALRPSASVAHRKCHGDMDSRSQNRKSDGFAKIDPKADWATRVWRSGSDTYRG